MIKSWLNNDLVLCSDNVYQLKDEPSIAYSDGKDAEQYLHLAFDACSDLCSNSLELESWIKDWPSEYHLSRKRAQLLNGFQYDSTASVLEVGCGCGAISRYLAEQFDTVISIEGSRERASLARKRCEDLSSITIISAPFQKISFKKKFDLIFCIGVFEYSSAFIESDDPYNHIIDYFSAHLNEGGTLIMAIENQFGLKYFSSASEDHTMTRYDGIEGYPRFHSRARTFGYTDLTNHLKRRFNDIDFYFPFPDYKVPDAVISERMFEYIDAGEFLGKFKSRDYTLPYTPLFSESLAWVEITKNKQAHFFSNSFLILASQGENPSISFPDLAVTYNRNRAEDYHTQSRIYLEVESNEICISKQPLLQHAPLNHTFTQKSYKESWHRGYSLHHRILRRAMDKQASLHEIFKGSILWHRHLIDLSKSEHGETGNINGNLVDAIWQNTFLDENIVKFGDQEWAYHRPFPLKVLTIRSIYRFLVDLRTFNSISRDLNRKTTRQIIHEVCDLYSLNIDHSDFSDFIDFETELINLTQGSSAGRARRNFVITLGRKQQTIRVFIAAYDALIKLRSYYRIGLRIVNRIYNNRVKFFMRPG